MRNTALEAVDVLVGEWTLTLTDAWLLESRDVRQHGRATDAGGTPSSNSKPRCGRRARVALRSRPQRCQRAVRRAVPRPEALTAVPDDLHRQQLDPASEDPDFHQRFVASVSADRIQGRWEASEDDGATWRKDFDLVFERTGTRDSSPSTPTRSNKRTPRSPRPTPAVLDSTRASGSGRHADTASRVIAARSERVFASLVNAEALAAWLPPDGMTARFEHFAPRPGGSCRLVLTYLNASRAHGEATPDSDIVEARYLDIVPGVRVVQAVNFVSDDPAFAGTMTMTWRSPPLTEALA